MIQQAQSARRNNGVSKKRRSTPVLAGAIHVSLQPIIIGGNETVSNHVGSTENQIIQNNPESGMD